MPKVNMKRLTLLFLSLFLVIGFCACANNSSLINDDSKTQKSAPTYENYIEELSSDPNSCGYLYSRNGATYTIVQKGNDVRIDFETPYNDDMCMSASRVNGQTVFVDKQSYFIDAAEKYGLPVDADSAVTDWLFDELKKYDNFIVSDTKTIDNVQYDILTATKKETLQKDAVDVAYNKYEVFLEWKDGQNYIMTCYVFDNEGPNVFRGNVPSEVSSDINWYIDEENNVLYNVSTNESYNAIITLLESYTPSGEIEESTKTVNVFVNRESQKVYKIQVVHSDFSDEYILLYPDAIAPVSTDGLEEMDASAAERVATMITLMLASL